MSKWLQEIQITNAIRYAHRTRFHLNLHALNVKATVRHVQNTQSTVTAARKDFIIMKANAFHHAVKTTIPTSTNSMAKTKWHLNADNVSINKCSNCVDNYNKCKECESPFIMSSNKQECILNSSHSTTPSNPTTSSSTYSNDSHFFSNLTTSTQDVFDKAVSSKKEIK